MAAVARTAGGGGRSHNQDSFGCFPELGLFVVVDGMGSRWNADEIAVLVIATLRDAYASGERSCAGLVAAIEAANRAVREQALHDPRFIGTGACVAALATDGSVAHLAHVGDCRIYRLHDSVLDALTEDHSLRNDWRRRDASEAEVEQLPNNVIVRALGMGDSVVVDHRTIPSVAGEIFLLTSDGLHGVLGERRMAETLLAHPRLDAAAAVLIDTALNMGGTDDLTAVLVRT
jgi:protein phosphatase